MPSRDMERAERLTMALRSDELSSLGDAIVAVGQGDLKSTSANVFSEVATRASHEGIAPEDLLVGVRQIAEPFIKPYTPEADRFARHWHSVVRVMMTAYFRQGDQGPQ